MANSQEIQARRERITDAIRDAATPLSEEEILNVLGGLAGLKAKAGSLSDVELASAMRMIQRDLGALQQQGFVEACRKFDGRIVTAQGPRRGTGKGKSTSPLLWRAGESLMVDEVDNVAALVAINALCDQLHWLVPDALTDDLIDARERVKLRIRKLRGTSIAMRWLSALKLETDPSPFERPMFDEDVRHAVEQAIFKRKKLQIEMDGKTSVVSVVGFVVKLPNKPLVEVVEDGDEIWPGGPLGTQRFRLETITHATVLDEDASTEAVWEPDEEPSAAPAIQYEFRACPRRVKAWAGTWLSDQLLAIGVDADGWTVYRYVGRPDVGGFSAYLSRLGPDVEVLKPLRLRESLADHFREARAMYEDERELPEDARRAQEDNELLVAWQGVPRVFNPAWLVFNENDRDRLAGSKGWQQEPEILEALCRALALEDPEGICLHENPHAATEYLQEADALFSRLPTVRSPEELAGELEAIFREKFAAPDLGVGLSWDGTEKWAALASLLWMELTGYRVKLRRLQA